MEQIITTNTVIDSFGVTRLSISRNDAKILGLKPRHLQRIQIVEKNIKKEKTSSKD